MKQENFDLPFFNDWRWQIKNSIKNIDDLKKFLPLTKRNQAWLDENFVKTSLPFSVTPYFASLMSGDENCPIFLQVLASKDELKQYQDDRRDPLGEEQRERVPNLIHRYPDRVLFLVTDRCAAYCRFCTRKRFVGQSFAPRKEEQEEAFGYINNDRNIKEIIFSGGDPFLLSNQRIEQLLNKAFSISHIEVVRFHSRMLSFAPMRIDRGLCETLQKFKPIYVVSHFNHPKEITKSTVLAIENLIECGVVLLNQSVLLKGVNDCEIILRELFRKLLTLRVRPYYMHQCDLVVGANHFRVPIKRSLAIMERLRGTISGTALPAFVVDIPDGHGKVLIANSSVVKEDEEYIYLQGFKGGVAAYPKN